MKTLFFITALAVLFFSCNTKNNQQKIDTKNKQTIKTENNKTTDSLTTLLNSAGSIKIYEPLRYLIGETDSANSYYDITLSDVGKYHGKVCPGIATGFFMFKDVLSQLYPNGDMPMRSNIAVACSSPNDMMDVAGYILGIRNFYGRGELGHGLLTVDTTLNPHHKRQFVVIFKRLDNKKTLKVTFNKFKILDNKNDWKLAETVLHKFKKHERLDSNLTKFQEMIHAKVKDVINNHTKYYNIEPYDNYLFSFEKDNN